MNNIQNATNAAANKVCNLYLVRALKGDTLLCSLGAGHNCAHVLITRNVHVANFIETLATTRQGLFNDPSPSQQVGRTSLCQVSELVFVDLICDLIDKDQNYSNISLTV